MTSIHSFRFEVDESQARKFMRAIRQKGFRTFSEWARSKVREAIEETYIVSFNCETSRRLFITTAMHL